MNRRSFLIGTTGRDPGNVALLRPVGVMSRPQNLPHLIEQLHDEPSKVMRTMCVLGRAGLSRYLYIRTKHKVKHHLPRFADGHGHAVLYGRSCPMVRPQEA